ncbi:SHOCT domain-containing protein [Lutibacter sp. HS1-25]|uniref:SHOCT domain-containing protein n=1 Tax=Lutibacter sp. HS1-25 TaxID=2485000 RepID=UPI0010132247|nr:SHOCT domain-containing protein [Lutibacter sp. HS1-25]RXP64554.1 SHOCT domain-containing protein [Lutibacter sp. HS1-25]
MDKIQELKKIKKLLDDGFINEVEFQVLKNEILGIKKPSKENSQKKEPKSTINKTIDNSCETEANNIDEVDLKTKQESEKSNEIKQENDSNNNEQKPSINKKPTKEDTDIKDLKETSKGEKVNFPKWGYLFLLLLIPLVWWVFKDTPTEEKLQEVEIKELNETVVPNSTQKKELTEDASLNITNTSNHFISNQELISLFNVNIEDLGDSFIGYDNSNKPQFKITSKQFFNIGDRELLLTSLGIKNPNDCHGCRGRLDIGFFEFLNGKWKKINHLKNASSASYGSFPTFNEFKFFGKNKLCIVFSAFDMGMGRDYSTRIIFGLNYNVLYEIARIIISENTESGMTYEESGVSVVNRKYEFIDTGKEYYTLKIIEKVNDNNEEIQYLNFNSNINEFQTNESTGIMIEK